MRVFAYEKLQKTAPASTKKKGKLLRSFFILLLLVFFGVGFGWMIYDGYLSSQADKYYKQGQECRQNQDKNCALDNFNKSISSYSSLLSFKKSTENYFKRGSVYKEKYNLNEDKNDLENALNDFVRVNTDDERNINIKREIGNIYYIKKEYDESIKWSNEAISLNPNDINVDYRSLSWSYYHKGEILQAQSYFWKIYPLYKKSYSSSLLFNPYPDMPIDDQILGNSLFPPQIPIFPTKFGKRNNGLNQFETLTSPNSNNSNKVQ